MHKLRVAPEVEVVHGGRHGRQRPGKFVDLGLDQLQVGETRQLTGQRATVTVVVAEELGEGGHLPHLRRQGAAEGRSITYACM